MEQQRHRPLLQARETTDNVDGAQTRRSSPNLGGYHSKEHPNQGVRGGARATPIDGPAGDSVDGRVPCVATWNSGDVSGPGARLLVESYREASKQRGAIGFNRAVSDTLIGNSWQSLVWGSSGRVSQAAGAPVATECPKASPQGQPVRPAPGDRGVDFCGGAVRQQTGIVKPNRFRTGRCAGDSNTRKKRL